MGIAELKYKWNMADCRDLVGDQHLFFRWIVCREEARHGRENNLPKPWTLDPVVQKYRFCNVRREDDKVTKWLRINWRGAQDGIVSQERMVLAMVIARTVNRVEMLEEIGFPDFASGHGGFDAWLDETRDIMKTRRAKGGKVWTGAYLVSTNGHTMDKIDYILDKVWTPIHKSCRAPIHNLNVLEGETLEQYHTYLMNFDGLGSFMAGQVIADLKYTSCLRHAPDWMSWAPIGPGSRRGLNRYFGRPLEANIKNAQVLEELAVLQCAVRQKLGLELPAHDIQNCCCEYDKYLRVRKGEGKPRSLYNGSA